MEPCSIADGIVKENGFDNGGGGRDEALKFGRLCRIKVSPLLQLR